MAMRQEDQSVRLDVESLRVFAEVVTQRGFTAAATSLGMTQPAVSKKIQRLEERLGVKLLLRSGQSITVTAHGRDLLGHAREIVAAHDRAVDHIRRSELEGKVRVGCNEEVAASGLANVVSQFRRSHPDIDLAIRVHDSAYVAEWLDDGDIDIALIQIVDGGESVRPTDDVWRRDTLVPLQSAVADFDEADPVPLISFGPRCLYEPWLMAGLEAAGRSARHAMECPSIQGVQRAIEAGLGVGVLNTPNVTDRMRPWTGITDLHLPEVAFRVAHPARSGRGRPDHRSPSSPPVRHPADVVNIGRLSSRNCGDRGWTQRHVSPILHPYLA